MSRESILGTRTAIPKNSAPLHYSTLTSFLRTHEKNCPLVVNPALPATFNVGVDYDVIEGLGRAASRSISLGLGV